MCVLALVSACGDDVAGGQTGESSGGHTSTTGDVSTETSTGPASDSSTTAAEPDTTTSGSDTTGGSESSSGPSTSSSDSGDDSSSGGDDSSSGSTGTQLLTCTALDMHYDGPLCGSTGTCTVEIDEVVDAIAAPRLDDPAIMIDENCQPRILSIAGALPGSPDPDPEALVGLAIRDGDGAWTHAAVPDTFTRGGLDYDAATGVTQVVVSFGSSANTRTWRYDGSDWAGGNEAHGYRWVNGRTVRPTGDATMRIVVTDNMVSITELAYDGETWNTLSDFQMGTGPRQLQVSGIDENHLSWRVPCTVGGQQCTTWRTPAAYEENAIVSTGFWPDWRWLPASTDDPKQPLAVDAADVPYIVTLQGAGPGALTTRIVRREGANTWVRYDVATDSGTICALEDAVSGETCDYAYTEYRPLEVVAAGPGQVAALIAVAHRQGTVLAAGTTQPYWTDVVDETTYDLAIAWLEDGDEGFTTDHTTLLTGRRITSAQAFVDEHGRIHAVLTEGTPELSTISYVRLSA